MITLLSFLFGPLKKHIKSSLVNYRLKLKYENLRISGNSVVSNSVLGRNNSIQDAILNNSKLGDFSYVGFNSYLNHVEVGKFTCIGPNVQIGLGEHPVNGFVSVHPVFYSPVKLVGMSFADRYHFKEFNEINIGNDVWIGANVIVTGGVNIGNGAVIAAGAVVVKDVAPYTVVGGVPARYIKTRFEKEEINKLEKFAWWDRDINWLKTNYKKFHSIKHF